MEAMTLQEIVATIRDGGAWTFLVLIVLGGARQWWVFGWQYAEKSKECEAWKTLALKGLTVAERIVGAP
jgi:hypothetical protein